MKTTSQETADAFDTVMPLLQALFREFQDLSKKKPDGVLNKNKIDIINRLLVDVLVILEGQPSRSYLDLLDADDVPQYSDVVVMLGQATAAMARFRSEHYGSGVFGYGWQIAR